MKHLSKWLCLVLAIMMCLSIVACGKGNSDTNSTSTSAAGNNDATSAVTDTTTESPYDANGYLKSDLPELNYNGETIHVFYWNDVEHTEYEADTQTGDLINDAIYQRNLNVSEILNVNLVFNSTKGNGSNIDNFVNAVGNSYKSGEKNMDLISSYSRTTAMLAMNGYLTDLAGLDYLDWEKPWWPASLLNVVSINNRVWFASGDASTNTLHMMYGIYYNKDLISELKLDDPVQLVRDGTWTLEKLQSMIKDTYQDLNNDGKKSYGDFFGFTTLNYHLDAFYTGSGLKLAETDPEKLMVISPSFFSEKAITLCSNLGEWLASPDAWCDTTNYSNAFAAGQAIFCQNRVRMAYQSQMTNVDFSYGVLPSPKYDLDQEDYITVMGNPFSLYGVYGNTADANRVAAVLECWASEAYRNTTPAVFELTLKLKYSETSNEADMYDIIRSTVFFDLGRLFNTQLSNITDIFFNAAVSNKSWASVTKAQKKPLEKTMEILANKFAALG